MDLTRLDPITYKPDVLIEGYEYLIWTERFADAGEFEMKTAKVDITRSLIPPNSLVSLVDSSVVMIVETHSVSRTDSGEQWLTVYGRSFESFLRHRLLLAITYNEPWVAIKPYTPSEFISLLLWNGIVNATGEDPTRATQNIETLTAIPNTMITDSTTVTYPAQSWVLESGELYSAVRDHLTKWTLGVRSIRPLHFTSYGYEMIFDTSETATRGDVTKTLRASISKLRLDVYNGVDRTRHQIDRTPLVFQYLAGHIDSPSYLMSDQDHKNIAVLATSVGSRTVWADTVPGSTLSGLDRKLLFMDGGSIGSLSGTAFTDFTIQKGLTELSKHEVARYFDGAISVSYTHLRAHET